MARESFYGDAHHMGTTRMHEDPMLGVVDVNRRVHGMFNLYVAGSSVFPTGSANNPTLRSLHLHHASPTTLKSTAQMKWMDIGRAAMSSAVSSWRCAGR